MLNHTYAFGLHFQCSRGRTVGRPLSTKIQKVRTFFLTQESWDAHIFDPRHQKHAKGHSLGVKGPLKFRVKESKGTLKILVLREHCNQTFSLYVWMSVRLALEITCIRKDVSNAF